MSKPTKPTFTKAELDALLQCGLSVGVAILRALNEEPVPQPADSPRQIEPRRIELLRQADGSYAPPPLDRPRPCGKLIRPGVGPWTCTLAHGHPGECLQVSAK